MFGQILYKSEDTCSLQDKFGSVEAYLNEKGLTSG